MWPTARRVRRGMSTTLSAARGLRRRKRFNCQDQLSPSWERRAEDAVDVYAKHRDRGGGPTGGSLRIADFGCGNERLRQVLGQRLGERHSYEGFDLRPQHATTTKLDLRREQPDGP